MKLPAKLNELKKLLLHHRRRWPIVPGFLLVLFILAAYASCGKNKTRPAGGAPLTAEVKRGQLTISVKANGEIQSSNPNKVVPAIKRNAKIKFLIPEGTRVKKGELVAKLNTEDLERRILDLENKVLEQKSKLNTAQTALEIQMLDNSSNLAKAEQELIEKEMELEKFYMGSASIDQYKADAKKENAEAELLRKYKVYDQYLKLKKKGYASDSEVDEKKLDYSKTYAEFETSRLELNQLEEYDYWINETKKKGEMDKARTELEKTRKANKTNLESKQQEVTTAKRALEATEKDLKNAKDELEAHEVKAPFDSVVMYGDANFWWSRRDIQVGKDANPGQVLVSLPDMNSLQAAVNVAEIDVHKVKIGQDAMITVEAAGGKIVHGKVLTVSEVANAGQGWLSSDTKEFKVEISLDNITALKPGISCQAEITIDKTDSVLILPVQAVFRDTDRNVVNPEEEGRKKSDVLTWMTSGYVVYPEKGGRREVNIGRSSLREVEITGDIKPGTKVLLMPPEGPAPEH
jgi:HlyD family secretion protein